MIHFEDANKTQLLQICLDEDCPIEYKYEAAAELQMRQWHEDYLVGLLRLWGEGKTSFQIAVELGIDESQVKKQISDRKLFGKREIYIPNNYQNCIMVEIKGETRYLADWARIKGIKYSTLMGRYKRGDRGPKLIRQTGIKGA